MEEKKNKKFTNDEINLIIDLAWDDNISFNHITKLTGATEKEIKNIMKLHLKKNSYLSWRERIKKYKKNRAFD